MTYYTEINDSTHKKEEFKETVYPKQHSLPDPNYHGSHDLSNTQTIDWRNTKAYHNNVHTTTIFHPKTISLNH